MTDENISFEEAMEIQLEAVDPSRHEFARIMMRAGAMLVLSAVNRADDISSLKQAFSDDPTTPETPWT